VAGSCIRAAGRTSDSEEDNNLQAKSEVAQLEWLRIVQHIHIVFGNLPAQIFWVDAGRIEDGIVYLEHKAVPSFCRRSSKGPDTENKIDLTYLGWKTQLESLNRRQISNQGCFRMQGPSSWINERRELFSTVKSAKEKGPGKIRSAGSLL